MIRKKILFLTMILFSALGMVSCSEEDNTVDEFANWQTVNEGFFYSLSDSVKSVIAANPLETEWKRIKTWNKSDSVAGVDTDYILVKVLQAAPATETEMPLYLDTVTVHYKGCLLPSLSYRDGYVFDISYTEPFDEDIAIPSKMAVANVVNGFSTAIQNMRRGDHWLVYIPYQLGYGAAGSSPVIPGYSTLVFDIKMVDFWSVDFEENRR
ncbi:FKBP-type peptidyl-prolyl cis-trans isomerase [Prevotella sp. PMUR]|uniref:Peptidyl-prolyl cis-trans isomerase n=2 Tax=Xylanibacter muris TaxID=2736290 RepID=A0ABX2ANU4_9BACT|nr:FKBP-type peptidyl-prolyl cis-trans isomerase [Xylanibacter muris]